MKKLWKSIVVGLALFIVAGCSGGTSPKPITKEPNVWQVALADYEFRDRLYSSIVGTTYYEPQAGYRWLVFSVTASNTSKSQKALELLTSSWSLLDGGGNEYRAQMRTYSIQGALPSVYHPGQTRSGDIYFEVPVGFDVSKSTLVFDYSGWDDPHQTVTMKP